MQDLATGAPMRGAALAMTAAKVSERGMMLMGYQRTKQISRQARLAWEAGDAAPLQAEIAVRREAVFAGVLAEIYAEYLPLHAALHQAGRAPRHVIDIGCGAGVNDLFLARDYGCAFSLVDIEETPEQYHLWSSEGSGYAALADARALLEENGTAPEQITCLNPRAEPEAVAALRGDLVTSLFSCGFHYPVGDYVELMLKVLEQGGAVALDLRKRYLKAPDAALSRLLASGEAVEVLDMEKSKRLLFVGR